MLTVQNKSRRTQGCEGGAGRRNGRRGGRRGPRRAEGAAVLARQTIPRRFFGHLRVSPCFFMLHWGFAFCMLQWLLASKYMYMYEYVEPTQ